MVSKRSSIHQNGALNNNRLPNSPASRALSSIRDYKGNEADLNEHLTVIYESLLEISRAIIRYEGPEFREELANQALFKIWRSRGKYDPSREAEKWFCAILDNTLKDEQRRGQRRRKMFPLSYNDKASRTDESSDIGELIPRSEEDPLILGERKKRLLKQLERLTQIQSSCITLVDLRGLSYQTAAAELKIPLGTVKSRIHASRQKLREILIAEKITP